MGINKQLMKDLDNRVYDSWGEVIRAIRGENKRETFARMLGYERGSGGGSFIRDIEENRLKHNYPSRYLIAALGKYAGLGIRRALDLDGYFQAAKLKQRHKEIKREYLNL